MADKEPAAHGKGGPQGAAASANSTAPAAAGERPTVALRYVDRPDCAETFANLITSVYYDGQTLRLEFAASWVDEVKPKSPVTGRRYPVCRLVLTPGAGVELINRMQQVAAALTQAGVLTAQQRPAEPPKATEPKD